MARNLSGRGYVVRYRAEMMRKTIYRCVLIPMLVVLLPSCINEFPHSSDVNQYDGIWLNIDIVVGNSYMDTRTEEYPDAECFIDIENDDFRIFIIDDRHIVRQRFIPSSVQLTQENGSYVYKLGGNIKPLASEFRVIVAVNWENAAFGGNYDDAFLLGQTTLNDLCDIWQSPDFIIRLAPDDYDSHKLRSWIPESGTAGIPMFGLSAKLYAGNTGVSVVDKVAIPMLRSLAKIEITNGTGDENIIIESCRLSKYNRGGRFIPDGINSSDWYKNPQVVKPSLPSNNNLMYSENVLFVPSDNGKRFTAYVPEMDLTEGTRPHIDVEISVEGVKSTYEIALAGYINGKPDENNMLEYLLRNHCYEFTVNSVNASMSAYGISPALPNITLTSNHTADFCRIPI